MKSVFVSQSDSKGDGSALKAHIIPEFPKLARRLVQQLRADLNANEVRALAANKVASPVLQVGKFGMNRGKTYLPSDAYRN